MIQKVSRRAEHSGSRNSTRSFRGRGAGRCEADPFHATCSENHQFNRSRVTSVICLPFTAGYPLLAHSSMTGSIALASGCFPNNSVLDFFAAIIIAGQSPLFPKNHSRRHRLPSQQSCTVFPVPISSRQQPGPARFPLLSRIACHSLRKMSPL